MILEDIAMFEKLVKTTRTWKQRQNERQELARLDDRSLRDMGIDRFRANREARKPFWKS